MSDLQKKWAKAKFNAMPEFNELDEDRESASGGAGAGGLSRLEQDDDSSSSASSVSSTGTIIPSPGRALFARPHGFAGRSLDPIPWTTYFERELFLKPDDDDEQNGGDEKVTSHHAYLTSPVGKGPLFVAHHGAGSSGLSFAVLSAEIRKRLPSAGILSPDARGHGSTTITTITRSQGEGEAESTTGEAKETAPSKQKPTVDLRLSTLSADLYRVIQLTKTAMKWPSLPPIILVGHSLGGAVVTDLARSGRLSTTTAAPGTTAPLLGYAVLDVVEGSAMDALQSMQTYLSTRPTGFATLRDAIDWHVRSRTIRNAVSARTSVPALLVDQDKDKEKEKEEGEEVEADDNDKKKTSSSSRPWKWRTDLAATQPFWEDWFVGLSKKFLEAKGGKLLLLAGTDRLDTELTIGQMQGKYALQVFPEAGHFIHEDLPEKTANVLVDFYRRNDRGALVLPPKVSELLAQGKRI
ncbi:Alpha/Beta hydrolase protein [Bombardia bombarda]|uniref:Protein phosphatase methylesterase 1 n=1 Tax=Bombardia bombarda TaxID=252184 RepID=A0AA40CAF3_9PEZI|nr:Alpha/Beta hydrolase protein [Bombardia bombarda]